MKKDQNTYTGMLLNQASAEGTVFLLFTECLSGFVSFFSTQHVELLCVLTSQKQDECKATVASETLEGVFLPNNSMNIQGLSIGHIH